MRWKQLQHHVVPHIITATLSSIIGATLVVLVSPVRHVCSDDPLTETRYAELSGRSEADRPDFMIFGQGCGGVTEDGAGEVSVTGYRNRAGHKIARSRARYSDSTAAFEAFRRALRSGHAFDVGPAVIGQRESVRGVVLLPPDEYGTHAAIYWTENEILHSIDGPALEDVLELEQHLSPRQ